MQTAFAIDRFGGGSKDGAMTHHADIIPDYQSLMLPVLKLSATGETHIRDAVTTISDQLGLSDEARALPIPSGGQSLIANRVHWAKTYLGKAGLIESPRRGIFTITDRGREVLATNPTHIDNKLLKSFDEFRDFQARRSVGPAPTVEIALPAESDLRTPDDLMRDAHAEIEAALADDLLVRVRAATPAFFENLVVRLLVAMGYGGSVADAGRAIGKSGDDGVDGVIDQDKLGLDQVYVQAKRYAAGNSVGSGAIRDFFGSLDRHKAAKGLFVTTSSYTSSARETASYLSKRIVLIDGDTLARLMIRHNVGCQIKDTLFVRRIDEDFFDG